MVGQEKNCYLGINGQKYGPVSRADIHKLYDSGKITGSTKFIRVGMKDWITLSESGIIMDDGLPPLPSDDGLPAVPMLEGDRVSLNIKKFASSKECSCLECGYNGLMGVVKSKMTSGKAAMLTFAFVILGIPIGSAAFIAILAILMESTGIGYSEELNLIWIVLVSLSVLGYSLHQLYPGLRDKKVLFCPNCEKEIIER